MDSTDKIRTFLISSVNAHRPILLHIASTLPLKEDTPLLFIVSTWFVSLHRGEKTSVTEKVRTAFSNGWINEKVRCLV